MFKIIKKGIYKDDEENFTKQDLKAFQNYENVRKLLENIRHIDFTISISCDDESEFETDDVNMVFISMKSRQSGEELGRFVLYNDDSFGREKCLQLQTFFIFEEFQGKGIGTYVLKHIAQNANKYGMYLYTETLRSNVTMYGILMKVGFTPVGIMRFPKEKLALFELVPTTE